MLQQLVQSSHVSWAVYRIVGQLGIDCDAGGLELPM